MNDIPDEPLMTDIEVAELLQVAPGPLPVGGPGGVGPPFFKFGNLIRYRRSEVLRWLEEQRIEPN